VSKKDMGAFRILRNILRWRCEEARSVPLAIMIEAKRIQIPEKSESRRSI
jgi:hypothetical protein